MQAPSAKKLGKRPELQHTLVETDVNMDLAIQDNIAAIPPIAPPATNRTRQQQHHPPPQQMQKRVLPIRQRRGGGPGIGNCSVDMLILETEKRAREARPVIPATQLFFLTTNSRLVPSSPETDAIDGEVSGSYFDKPEVRAAYLAQKAIQVPEFSPLPDDAVGGRLRARAPEEGEETQDMAYIKRHQKYETFEKRQRRREKEKLMHEHYKLKERIDQLKGMDASAFGPGGESRRKEMLDTAINLESRYTLLLPPEPRRPKKSEKKRHEGVRTGTTTGEDADTEDETAERPSTTRPPAMKERGHTRPAPQQQPSMPPPVPNAPKTPAVTVALEVNEVPHIPRSAAYIAPNAFNAPPKRDSSRGAAKAVPKPPLQKKRALPETAPPREVTPPRKRPRMDAHTRRITPIEAPSHTQSLLLQIAMRKAAQPNARQTSRVINAFGFAIPSAIEEEVYYELPEYVTTQSHLEEQYRRKIGSISDGDPPGMSGSVGPFKQEFEAGHWTKEPGHLNGGSGTNGATKHPDFLANGEDAMDLDATLVPVTLEMVNTALPATNGVREPGMSMDTSPAH